MSIILPADHTYFLPSVAVDWLHKYEITEEELIKYRIGWSSLLQRIIFPIYTNGYLLFWQGRYCPEPHITPTKQPKYWTMGQAENVMALFGKETQTSPSRAVCLVEDFVSAIKIARVMPTHCLFGSEISIRRLLRLSFLFEEILIWLDPDKASHSARCELKARPYFDFVGAIYSHSDPKAHSMKEIEKWIAKP